MMMRRHKAVDITFMSKLQVCFLILKHQLQLHHVCRYTWVHNSMQKTDLNAILFLMFAKNVWSLAEELSVITKAGDTIWLKTIHNMVCGCNGTTATMLYTL